MSADLGTFGVWRSSGDLSPELAVELERLGYATVWIGGSPNGDLALAGELLDATDRLMVATGIVNVWSDPAEEVAASFHRIDNAYPGRFVLGIGVGHPEARSDYSRPYAALERYLDVLDDEAVPAQQRVLAALGPKMLRLAAERSAGAHPYLTTPAHTRAARQLIGPDRLLAPEHKAVLERDDEAARAIGRQKVRNPYLGLTNYTSNLRRLGYGDDDLADGGSDRLIDALVAHGDAATVAAQLSEHLAAGADHVALQLLTAPGADPVDGYRELARVLFS